MFNVSTELVKELSSRRLTISTAESCTGGLIAKSITDISGASEVFWGGVVSYDNSVKENVLRVKHETLTSYGAVSAQTACEMAEGVRNLCKTDIGISTTGIAGPGGGTKEKPVGTVYVAIATKDGVSSTLLQINPQLSRDEIRQSTVCKLISMVVEKIRQIY